MSAKGVWSKKNMTSKKAKTNNFVLNKRKAVNLWKTYTASKHKAYQIPH